MNILPHQHGAALPVHPDPLAVPSQQVLDDVSEEHARKTITVEPHPHLSLTAASIHPCRHGEVMKRLVDNIIEGGGSFGIEQ